MKPRLQFLHWRYEGVRKITTRSFWNLVCFFFFEWISGLLLFKEALLKPRLQFLHWRYEKRCQKNYHTEFRLLKPRLLFFETSFAFFQFWKFLQVPEFSKPRLPFLTFEKFYKSRNFRNLVCLFSNFRNLVCLLKIFKVPEFSKPRLPFLTFENF